MDDSFPSDNTFNAIFTIACIVIAIGFVFTAVAFVRNWQAAKRAGYDPLAMQTQIAAKAMNSKLLAPQESLEERLAKIDDLKARGVITEAEHASARADIIREA